MDCNCMNTRNSDMSESELLMQISQIQFICIELNLYLDTHPDDEAAMRDYISYGNKLNELIGMYEERYGPIHGFGHSATETGSWVYSEWPWD